ncbi:hypothetical protein [Pseudomonas sp. NPDC007930]|uniref:hypothetical protein n=1 Tax=Pseudomonas sp. NPDC007930 TaxID=3364417 RepID=UPI0036F0EAFA
MAAEQWLCQARAAWQQVLAQARSGHTGAPDDPYLLHRVGEAGAQLQAAEALLRRAQVAGSALALAQAEYSSAQAAQEVAQLLLALGGSPAPPPTGPAWQGQSLRAIGDHLLNGAGFGGAGEEASQALR